MTAKPPIGMDDDDDDDTNHCWLHGRFAGDWNAPSTCSPLPHILLIYQLNPIKF